MPARIVGGAPADIATFPHQVSVTSAQGLRCGGAIVAAGWVVTAAHCVDDQPRGLEVLAGITRLSDRNDAQRSAIARVVLHPEYDGGSPPRHDVALLRLAVPLDLDGDSVAAIPLVDADDVDDGLTDPGVVATVSGWGRTDESGPLSDVLRTVDVPIVDNAEASAQYGVAIDDTLLAAGVDVGGKDSCAGDSGGGLVVPGDDGDWRLAGIVSWGAGCGRPELPGIYARVSAVHAWIDRSLHDEAPACDDGEWACHDGPCIDARWLCDGEADCDDGTDELECHGGWRCDEGELLCDGAWCVPESWACDGEADCDDGTDEEDCA